LNDAIEPLICKVWDNKNVINSVSFPERTDSISMRKFKIKLGYLDKQGKFRSKVIKFGDKRRKDFTDDGADEKAKRYVVNSLRKCSNPFQPNFWRLHLLNNTPNLAENYKEMLAKIYEKKIEFM